MQSDQHFESPAGKPDARVVCIDDFRQRLQSRRGSIGIISADGRRLRGGGLNLPSVAEAEEEPTLLPVLHDEWKMPWSYEFMVRSSETLRQALIDLPDVAQTARPILITAENGMGTEIFARAIHELSHRPPQAFVRVNCAAMPRSSFASGSFDQLNSNLSGTQPRLGRFQLAERGTIFLDGIEQGNLEILQVLVSGKYESHPPPNVRLIGSIHPDRGKALLRPVPHTSSTDADPVFLRIPPLRERREDIPALVRHFFRCHASISGKKVLRLSQKTTKILQSYPWPGNLRELQHVLERFVALAEAETLSVNAQWISWETSSTSESFVPAESELVEAALLEMLAELPGWEPETCREIWMEASDHEMDLAPLA